MYLIKEHSIMRMYKNFHAIMLKDVWENAFFVLMDNWLRCALVKNARPSLVHRPWISPTPAIWGTPLSTVWHRHNEGSCLQNWISCFQIFYRLKYIWNFIGHQLLDHFTVFPLIFKSTKNKKCWVFKKHFTSGPTPTLLQKTTLSHTTLPWTIQWV